MPFTSYNRIPPSPADDINDFNTVTPLSLEPTRNITTAKKTRSLTSRARDVGGGKVLSRAENNGQTTKEGDTQRILRKPPLTSIPSLTRKHRRSKSPRAQCVPPNIRGLAQAKYTLSWDRFVFVLFCGCCLLLLRALAGLGPIVEDPLGSPLVRSGSYYAHSKGHFGVDQSMRGSQLSANSAFMRVLVDWQGDYSIAHDHSSPSSQKVRAMAATLEEDPVAPTPYAMPTSVSATLTHDNVYDNDDRASTPMTSQVPAFYDPRYDPIHVQPFFDPEEYDNEGKPYALKIHLKPSSIYDGEDSSDQKCRNGRTRCRI